ncbi:MAG: hypothetical protein VB089_13585 [Anaerolineaceae bacterium]|nr:hypothetical protein [Anaerolineaceae bacterium]
MRITDFIEDVGRPVSFYPGLRRITKSTTGTLLLCQLIYWHGKQQDVNGWILKTSGEIEYETGLSYEEQKTARAALIRNKLIEEDYRRIDHIMAFRVNLDAINEAWEATENTAKTTVPERANATFGNEPMPRSGTWQSPVGEQGNATIVNRDYYRD